MGYCPHLETHISIKPVILRVKRDITGLILSDYLAFILPQMVERVLCFLGAGEEELRSLSDTVS